MDWTLPLVWRQAGQPIEDAAVTGNIRGGHPCLALGLSKLLRYQVRAAVLHEPGRLELFSQIADAVQAAGSPGFSAAMLGARNLKL
jgi:hypothetical protein